MGLVLHNSRLCPHFPPQRRDPRRLLYAFTKRRFSPHLSQIHHQYSKILEEGETLTLVGILKGGYKMFNSLADMLQRLNATLPVMRMMMDFEFMMDDDG